MPLIRTALDRVCIVMLSAVGDVVHTLPVVSAFKRFNPAMHIAWILHPGPASLLEGHPDIDERLIFDRRRGLAELREIRAELARRRFDVTLAMQSYFKAGLLTGFTRAPVKLGFDRRRARDLTWLFTTHRLAPRPERHFQEQYLEFLEALGVPAEPLEWKLGPWEHELAWRDEFASAFTRPIASVVVGTSRPERDWPAGRWAEVCDALYSDFGLAPVLVGGSSERERAAEATVLARARVPVVSTLGEPFRRLVSILDASALVLTPNTGPMHMAVALNRPTISLHGFANPKRVGPYQRFHDLMIDEYGEPGEDYPITRRNRRDRMQRISVQQVLERVQRWRTRYARVQLGPGE